MEETKIAEYVDRIVSGNDVQHSKPAPNVYLQALAAAELAAWKCIAAEDSRCRIEAARSEGHLVVGVYCEPGPAARETADGQIRIVTEFSASLNKKRVSFQTADRDIR